MSQVDDKFPEKYKKMGERAVYMYQRRNPSGGMNFAPAHVSAGQFGPYFHGTSEEFSPGDEITPANSRNARRSTQASPGANTYGDPGDHTYAAHNRHQAAHYGDNVYEVEPVSAVHPDPESPEQGVRSYGNMRVVRKVTG